MSLSADLDMGRILIDLSDDVIQRLDNLKQLRNRPRAELLREAIEQYLDQQSSSVIRDALACGETSRKMGLSMNASCVRSGNYGAHGGVRYQYTH
jgi:predicted transcriptional regulator